MKTILAIAIAATSFVASTVNAQSTGSVSVRVSYADLKLDSAAGRATLNRRIGTAVRSVCDNGSTDLAATMAANRCMSQARASAQTQIAAASSTALVFASR